jgi:hypothetical protein
MGQYAHQFDEPVRTRRFIYNGISLIIGAVGIGVVGAIALGLMSESLHKTPEAAELLPPLALWCISNSGWLPVLAAPSFLVGLALLGRRWSRPAGWLVFVLAMAWLLSLFVAILCSFIAYLRPLYEYQPL